MDMATFVGRYLAARGVTLAFGHPGSDVLALINGMEEAGIRFILTHHENTAAYMASTVGRLTGLPGVALVTKGPGVTNVASGVAAAHQDRAPLLMFSSHIDEARTATYVHQHLPVTRFYETITKLSEEITAANAHELLPRAFATAVEPLPGSSYLPSAEAQQTKAMGVSDNELEQIIARPFVPPSLGLPDLSEAARLVAAAKRLMVVVGPGVATADASDDLVALLDALGAPVCVTPEAIGQVPADHPLYAGMYAWHDAPLPALLKGADLVLTIGLDGWDVMTTYSGPAPVVSLSEINPRDPTFQPVAHALQGDLRRLMRALSEEGRGEREWGADIAASSLATIDRDLEVSPEHAETDGIPPQTVIKSLRALLPRDTIFACDVGAHKSLACQAWRSYGPKTYLVSNGLSPMGVGLANAMAAKLVQPDKPVAAVVGDGGFLMYAGELATWARLNLPLTLVVAVDNNLTQVQRRQERRGYSLGSTTFQEVNFCALARVFGIDAIRADTTADYAAAVEKAAAANRPVLVEAHLDRQEWRRIPGAP